MLFVDQDSGIEDMGYAFSRLETDSELLDGSSFAHELSVSPQLNRQLHTLFFNHYKRIFIIATSCLVGLG